MEKVTNSNSFKGRREIRRNALRVTLFGMTTLAAFQAMAEASSAPVELPAPDPTPTGPAPKVTLTPAESAVTPVVSPTATIEPDTAPTPTFSSPAAAAPRAIPPKTEPKSSPLAQPSLTPSATSPSNEGTSPEEPAKASASPGLAVEPSTESQSVPSTSAITPSTTPATSQAAPSSKPETARAALDAAPELNGPIDEDIDEVATTDAVTDGLSTSDVAAARDAILSVGSSNADLTSLLMSIPAQRTVEIPSQIAPQITPQITSAETGETVNSTVYRSADRSSLEYQLQPGDTLGSIAIALDIPVAALTEANDITETTLLIAGEALTIPDDVPEATTQGVALKADFAALQTPVAESEPTAASEADESAISTESDNRLAYLQSTVDQPIDRAQLLEQLRPGAVSEERSDAAALTAETPSNEAPAETTPDIAVDLTLDDASESVLTLATDESIEPDASRNSETDIYASRLLASLRAPVTVVETESINRDEPATDIAAASVPQPARSSTTASEVATASVRSTSVISPAATSPAAGRTVRANEPVLPGRENYLPQPTDEVDGFIWPTRGVISSGYGWRWGRMHRGVDIAAPTGTPIVASAPGVIEYAGWNNGGYGNLVDIRHADGSLTRYAHNSRVHVEVGQQVQQGELIAEMGSTGYSTGPHLHFEIHQPTEGTINPMALMPDQRLLSAR